MIIDYSQISRLNLDPKIMQRLGVDPVTGRALVDDGIVGPATERAQFYNPQGPHPKGVQAAILELLDGAREIGGNNRGPWVAKYTRDPKAHISWCAAFASWCLQEDYGSHAPYSWGARRLLLSCEPLKEPVAGAVIGWSRDSAGPHNGHCGLVLGVYDGFLWVIEGNTVRDGAVRVHRYEAPYNRGADRCLGFGEVKL